jgi:membrane-associated phospholipid phosphatase
MQLSNWTLLILFTVILCLCAISYIWLDLLVTLYMRHELPADIYRIFRVITDIGKADYWFVLFGIPAIGLTLYHRTTKNTAYQHYAYMSWFGVASLAASGILINVLKFMIGRYRPRYYFSEEQLYGFLPFNMDFGMNSFPSGHSQTIWAAMTVLALLFPKFPKLALFGLAASVAISRVIVGSHFISDILMGSFIGFAMTLIMYKKLKHKLQEPVYHAK